MNRKFPGILMLMLLAAAITIGAWTIFQSCGLAYGFGYLICCFFAFGCIIRAFCAKCLAKRDCPHVLLGCLAVRMERDSGPYTRLEISVLIIALVFILGIPQLWIWHFPVRIAVFWLLNILAVSLAPCFLCVQCSNRHCPLNRNRKQKKEEL